MLTSATYCTSALSLSVTFPFVFTLYIFTCWNLSTSTKPLKKFHFRSHGNIWLKNPAYGRHRISRPMRIVGPIKFWRVCVIYLEKKIKNGRLMRPRVHAYTHPRVHMTDPRGGDGCSAPTPRF